MERTIESIDDELDYLCKRISDLKSKINHNKSWKARYGEESGRKRKEMFEEQLEKLEERKETLREKRAERFIKENTITDEREA